MRHRWIGCSGWNYDDWRGRFYPEDEPRRRWLELYSQTFDTVEVNNTFYRLPEKATTKGWAEQTPDGFLFAVKASRYLTHVKRLRKIGNGIRRFMARVKPLAEAGKLGPVLWQLPPDFKRDDERLDGFLGVLPEGRHALEPRHESWFEREVYDRLGDAGVALVVADDPEQDFGERVLTTDWTYVRFHRGRKGRGGKYSDAEIVTWRRRIAAWRRRAEVFAYFNNDWEAFAPQNALVLRGDRSG